MKRLSSLPLALGTVVMGSPRLPTMRGLVSPASMVTVCPAWLMPTWMRWRPTWMPPRHSQGKGRSLHKECLPKPGCMHW